MCMYIYIYIYIHIYWRSIYIYIYIYMYPQHVASSLVPLRFSMFSAEIQIHNILQALLSLRVCFISTLKSRSAISYKLSCLSADYHLKAEMIVRNALQVLSPFRVCFHFNAELSIRDMLQALVSFRAASISTPK